MLLRCVGVRGQGWEYSKKFQTRVEARLLHNVLHNVTGCDIAYNMSDNTVTSCNPNACFRKYSVVSVCELLWINILCVCVIMDKYTVCV